MDWICKYPNLFLFLVPTKNPQTLLSVFLAAGLPLTFHSCPFSKADRLILSYFISSLSDNVYGAVGIWDMEEKKGQNTPVLPMAV